MTRTTVLTLLSCAAAVAAIVGLLEFSQAGSASVGGRLAEIGAGAIAVIGAASLAQVAISAIKWRLVLAAFGTPEETKPGFRLSFLLASLAAVVAQFLPLMIAAVTLRSLVARYALRTPVLEAALASAVEQAFDVLAFSLLVLPTLAVVMLGLGGVDAGFDAWLTGAAVVLGAAFLALGARPARLARKLALALGMRGRWSDAFDAISRIDASLQRRLLALSVLRYGSILLRALVVSRAAGFALPAADVVYGHTVVQAAQLAAVTPGNLGLAEWTWVGTLGYLGQDVAAVAVFTLCLRVVSVAAYLFVLCLAILLSASPGLRSWLARPRRGGVRGDARQAPGE